MQRKLTVDLLEHELVFTMSRSGGPGGQNVNKVNSKVTLQFDVSNSAILTAEEKEILHTKLSSRMTRDGILMLSVQEHRSQIQNKEAVREKFSVLLKKAFIKQKVRKPTKPSRSAKLQRMKKKKVLSEKKKWRKKPDSL